MNEALAFMHIPKSAGTALTNALLNLPKIQSEAHGWDRSLFGAYDEFHTWDQGRRPSMFLEVDELPCGKDLIFGHIGYSSLKDRYPHAKIFTILRHPRTRLLSLWVFWRAKPDNLQLDIGTYATHVYSARGSLKSFLENTAIAAQTDNVAARMLLWPSRLIPDNGFIEEKNVEVVIEEALSNIINFDFVDLYENIRMQQNISIWLSENINLNRDNETAQVPYKYRTDLRSELSSGTLDLIHQRTRIDEVIWRKVASRVCPELPISLFSANIERDAIRKYERLLAPKV